MNFTHAEYGLEPANTKAGQPSQVPECDNSDVNSHSGQTELQSTVLCKEQVNVCLPQELPRFLYILAPRLYIVYKIRYRDGDSNVHLKFGLLNPGAKSHDQTFPWHLHMFWPTSQGKKMVLRSFNASRTLKALTRQERSRKAPHLRQCICFPALALVFLLQGNLDFLRYHSLHITSSVK